MRTRHLMALFTGVLILAIILPIHSASGRRRGGPKYGSIVNWIFFRISSFGRCGLADQAGSVTRG